MFFSIIYNKRVFGGEWPVVCCWVAFRGSTKKLYSEDLSGILHLGFQQILNIKDASGDLNRPEGVSTTKRSPTGSCF